MLLIDPQGNYPRHIGDIALANPGWEEGQALPEGWIYVNPTEIPSHDLATQKLEELAPTLGEDGQYYQTWNVRGLTEAELEIVNAPTNARNRLVALGFTEAEINALFMGLR
jgi:hypothetical protein